MGIKGGSFFEKDHWAAVHGHTNGNGGSWLQQGADTSGPV
jgi:hypothetical protein